MATSDTIDLTGDDPPHADARSTLLPRSALTNNTRINTQPYTHCYKPSYIPQTPRKRKRNDHVLSSFHSFGSPPINFGSDEFGSDDLIQPSSGLSSNLRRDRFLSSVSQTSNTKSQQFQTPPEQELDMTPGKRRKGQTALRTAENKNLRDLLPGTIDHPIELIEDENLFSAIKHGFPGSQSTRPLRENPNLQILGSRKNNNSEEDDDAEMNSESSDSDSQGVITVADFMDDSQIDNYMRKLSIAESRRFSLTEHKAARFTCAKGKSVELKNGSFMRIQSVARNEGGDVFIRGNVLVRQTTLSPVMPRTHNELVWLINSLVDADSSEVSVSEIVQNRAVIFTNQKYASLSSRNDGDTFPNVEQNYKFGPLFCRWKREVSYNARGKIVSETYSRLLYEDADCKPRRGRTGEELHLRIADSRNRSAWRGVTKPGGSYIKQLVDVEGNGEAHTHQQYIYGDAFCGAGGTSRGAFLAGLMLKWAFDYDEQAIRSYQANFEAGGTDCRHEAVFEFLERVEDGGVIVDILHLSPPCQTFSWAKTFMTPEQDEKNEAVLFSVGELLKKAKPRIVTMEETDGLVAKHKDWFHALLHVFIHCGYSVKWKVLNLEEYGVPQKRKRLVIIAAGPGEKLPPFPEPTYGERSIARQPLVTINDCIKNIKIGSADHNLDTVCYWNPPKVAFSGETLANTLTTGGGIGNYHPSGLRHYTIRENASLQTFPLCHKFTGGGGIGSRRKQIGNAVPPAFAQALFRTIIESLRSNDTKGLRMSQTGLVV